MFAQSRQTPCAHPSPHCSDSREDLRHLNTVVTLSGSFLKLVVIDHQRKNFVGDCTEDKHSSLEHTVNIDSHFSRWHVSGIQLERKDLLSPSAQARVGRKDENLYTALRWWHLRTLRWERKRERARKSIRASASSLRIRRTNHRTNRRKQLHNYLRTGRIRRRRFLDHQNQTKQTNARALIEVEGPVGRFTFTLEKPWTPSSGVLAQYTIPKPRINEVDHKSKLWD